MLTRAKLDMEAQCYDHPVTCDTCTSRSARHLATITRHIWIIWLDAGCCRCTCCDVSSTCRTLEDAGPGLLLTAPADTARSRPAMEFILLRYHKGSPHSAIQLSSIGEKLPLTKVSVSQLSSQTCRSVI